MAERSSGEMWILEEKVRVTSTCWGSDMAQTLGPQFNQVLCFQVEFLFGRIGDRANVGGAVIKVMPNGKLLQTHDAMCVLLSKYKL